MKNYRNLKKKEETPELRRPTKEKNPRNEASDSQAEVKVESEVPTKIKFQGRSSTYKEEKTKSVAEVECPTKRNPKSRPNVLD